MATMVNITWGVQCYGSHVDGIKPLALAEILCYNRISYKIVKSYALKPSGWTFLGMPGKSLPAFFVPKIDHGPPVPCKRVRPVI